MGRANVFAFAKGLVLCIVLTTNHVYYWNDNLIVIFEGIEAPEATDSKFVNVFKSYIYRYKDSNIKLNKIIF